MPEQTISTIDFHGTEIIAIAGDTPATTLIPMKPLVEGMGMQWHGQFERIQQNQILAEGIRKIIIPSAGGPQEMIALPLSLINGWLIGIQPTRIKDHRKRMLIFAYQREAFDVLFRHFFGKATGQTYTGPTLDEIVSAVETRLEAKLEAKFEPRFAALEAGFNKLAEGFAELARRSHPQIEGPRSRRHSYRPMKTMRSILLSIGVLPGAKGDAVYRRCANACAEWCDASGERESYIDKGNMAARMFDEEVALEWYASYGKKIVRAHRRIVKGQSVMKFPKPKIVEPV